MNNFWRNIMQKEISGKKMISNFVTAERERCEQQLRELANTTLQTAVEKTCSDLLKVRTEYQFMLHANSAVKLEFTMEGYLKRNLSGDLVIAVQFCVYYYNGCSIYWPFDAVEYYWHGLSNSVNPDLTATNLVRILDEEFSSFFEVETGNVEFTSETSSGDRQIFKKSVTIEF